MGIIQNLNMNVLFCKFIRKMISWFFVYFVGYYNDITHLSHSILTIHGRLLFLFQTLFLFPLRLYFYRFEHDICAEPSLWTAYNSLLPAHNGMCHISRFVPDIVSVWYYVRDILYRYLFFPGNSMGVFTRLTSYKSDSTIPWKLKRYLSVLASHPETFMVPTL